MDSGYDNGIYSKHNKVLPVLNNSKQPVPTSKRELLFALEEKKNSSDSYKYFS